jgi:hypothetical protein
MSGFMWKKFVSRISEADADGGSVDFGVFCVRDEHAEGIDGLTFIIRLTRTGSNLEAIWSCLLSLFFIR